MSLKGTIEMEINGFRIQPLWMRRLFGTYSVGTWAVYRDIHNEKQFLAEVYDEHRDAIKSHRFRSLTGAKRWAERESALIERCLHSQLEAI